MEVVIVYQFKHSDMKYSHGGLDELLALDRYVVSTNDPNDINVGDTVVALLDKKKDIRKVGVVLHKHENEFKIKTRDGDEIEIDAELISKPLEHTPQELWERWAKGAASVEKDEIRAEMEDRFRKFLDGYGYSPGGRIQLMLGQEFVTGKRANLTGYNCFVLGTPKRGKDAIDQWMKVLDAAYEEMLTMRTGGGVGFNISEIQTVEGAKDACITFFLPQDHKDYDELVDKKKIGLFDDVEVYDQKQDIPSEAIRYIVEDSIEGLVQAMKDMVIHAYTRPDQLLVMDFTNIRHRNAIVKGIVNGRSSGAESWMELFSLIVSLLKLDLIDVVEFAEIFAKVTLLIIQGGSRRGALMLILSMLRRDAIRKFITRKQTPGKLVGANISVGIDDGFMEQLFAGDSEAEELWNLITHSAWKSAEPGIVWLERCNKESNSWYFHPLVATNPCGEQPLPEYGVCNLGHLVLPRYAYGEQIGEYKIDWEALEFAVRTAVRFQDNVIDYTDYFLPKNREVQLSERRIGCGSMGLGTLLILMGIRYGSPESLEFLDELYSKIAYWAYDESINIAAEKGPFPKFEYEKFVQSGFMKRLLSRFPQLDDKLKKYGIRNVTILTQAPTGSTATLLDNIPGINMSTGIEPYFAWGYYRASRGGGTTYQEVELVQQYRRENGLSENDPLPDYFVTAMELTPEEHVRVQAAIQKWVDSAISKTANAPSTYTPEDVDKLYRLGYELGLKGITVYLDGSREAQVLSTKKENAKLESHIEAERIEALKKQEQQSQEHNAITKRPQRLFGFTEKVRIPLSSEGKMGKVYITINVDPESGLPIEVFVNANDPELRSTGAALGRMTTQFLRFGKTRDNVEQAVKHLRKGEHMGTLPFTLASLLERVAYGKIEFPGAKKKPEIKLQPCPKCEELTYDKGSCVCLSCGYSSCN
jgi:ribonucleoside-diphosphate reductase alpha chain